MPNKPFCGYPYGFHEFASLPEMPEDDCCVHCGKPKREIERNEPEKIKCNCPEWDQDPHMDYRGICVACGRPFQVMLTDEEFKKLQKRIKETMHELEVMQAIHMRETGRRYV